MGKHEDIAAHELHQAALQAHRNNQQEEAILLMEQAIRMTTLRRAKSLYLTTIGSYFHENGEYEKAAVACAEAVSLTPNNFHVFTQLGHAQLSMREYAAATKSFKKAVGIRADEHLFAILAWLRLPIDPSEAKEYARKALELEPSCDESRALLKAAEEAEKGKEVGRLLRNKTPDPFNRSDPSGRSDPSNRSGPFNRPCQ